jgi:hypothetical protein
MGGELEMDVKEEDDDAGADEYVDNGCRVLSRSFLPLLTP